jgi:hypothetical protein
MDDGTTSSSKNCRHHHPQQQQQMSIELLSNEELTRLQHPNNSITSDTAFKSCGKAKTTTERGTAAISSSCSAGALGTKPDMLQNRFQHCDRPLSSALECGVAHVKVTLQPSLPTTISYVDNTDVATISMATRRENTENVLFNGSSASSSTNSAIPPVYIIRHKEMFSALWPLSNNGQQQQRASTATASSPTALYEQEDSNQNGLAAASAFDLAEWQPINEGNHIIHRVLRKIKQMETSKSRLSHNRGRHKGEGHTQSPPGANESALEKMEATSTTAPGEASIAYALIISHPDDRLYYPEQYRRWRFAFECLSATSSSSPISSSSKDSTASTTKSTKTEENSKNLASRSPTKPDVSGNVESLAKKDLSLLSVSDMIFGGGWKPYFRLNRAQQLLVNYTHAPETTLILWSLWPNSDISIVVDPSSSTSPAGPS